MNKTAITMAMVAFLITPVWAEEAPKERIYTDAEKAFRKADIINDGRLDKGEFDIYSYLTFQEMDKDKDRILTPSECLKNCFKDAKGEGRDGAVVDMSSTAMDIDENGQVSDFEYLMFKREQFDQIDADSNRYLDKEEFCSAYDLLRPCAISKLPS